MQHFPLDRHALGETFQILSLRVAKKTCGALLPGLRPHLLNIPRQRQIVNDGVCTATKLMLFNKDVQSLSQLPEQVQKLIAANTERAELVPYAVTLDYDYFTVDHVLRKLLPPGIEAPSSFETIGHIAHINLRSEQLPYKSLIGQVMLDKNFPRIKTVVNKVGTINNEYNAYRVFEQEVIAGEHDFVTTVRENSCIYMLDYSKVYWNSRLEAEHRRLVATFQAGDTICDMMAGIGPFAVPAAKRGLRVLANDLNPVSYEYLCKNIKQNKVAGDALAFNLDGREFVRQVASGDIGGSNDTNGSGTAKIPFDRFGNFQAAWTSTDTPACRRVILNLPNDAPEFTDAFIGIGLLGPRRWPSERLPVVHCYCFARGANAEACREEIITRFDAALGSPVLASAGVAIHDVRDVAPGKRMYCVSFTLPEAVAYSTQGRTNDCEEHTLPLGKRPRHKE